MQILSSLFAAATGLAMLAACAWFVLSLEQKRWKWFSDRFGMRELPRALASKAGGPVVISSAPHREAFAVDYTSYLATRLSVHERGLSIQPRKPNYYLNQPFLLPFDGLMIHPSRWADLLFETVALSHSALPGAYIIMAKSDIDWAIANGAELQVGAAAASG